VFIKACLVSIIVLLAAILMTQRAEKVVHAQGHIEYKVVDVEVDVPADWKSTLSGGDTKYITTQDALNEYGKNGWQLVSANYWLQGGYRSGRLIFTRK
jgi:hypothetical protein